MAACDEPADAGLDEGWEKLDDNYSILSVPTSDEEGPEEDLVSTAEVSLSCELVSSPKPAPSLEPAPSPHPVTASIPDDQHPSEAATEHPQKQPPKFPSPSHAPALNPRGQTGASPSGQQKRDDQSKSVSPPQVVRLTVKRLPKTNHNKSKVCAGHRRMEQRPTKQGVIRLLTQSTRIKHKPVVSPQAELPKTDVQKTDVPKPAEMPLPSMNQLDVSVPAGSTPEQKTHDDKSNDAVCIREPESEKPSLKLVLMNKTEDTACWFRRNIHVDLKVTTTEPATAYHRLETLEHGIEALAQSASGEKYYQAQATDIVMICHLLSKQIREIKPPIASTCRLNKLKGNKANVEITPDFSLWIASVTQIVSAISRGIDVLGFPKEGLRKIDQITRITTLENLIRFLVPYSCEVHRLISTHKSREESSPSNNNDGPLPHWFYDHLERNPDLEFCITEHVHNLERVLNQLKQEFNRAIEGMDEWCASLPRDEAIVTKDMSRSLSTFGMLSIDVLLEDISFSHDHPSHEDISRLSLAEFRNINPFTVEKFANRLKTIYDAVQLGPVESRIWSADEIREHYRSFLIDHGLFRNLCGVYRNITRFLTITSAARLNRFPSKKAGNHNTDTYRFPV